MEIKRKRKVLSIKDLQDLVEESAPDYYILIVLNKDGLTALSTNILEPETIQHVLLSIGTGDISGIKQQRMN